MFALAATASAALVGAACGLLGVAAAAHAPSLRAGLAGLVAAVAGAYGIAESRGAQWWVPQRHWQVPQAWGWHGRFVFATAFGLVLGAGFLTLIPFIGYYLLVALCVVAADPVRGGVLMGLFGAARAVPVLAVPLVSWARRQPQHAQRAAAANDWLAGVDRRLAGVRALTLLAVAGSAVALTIVLAAAGR